MNQTAQLTKIQTASRQLVYELDLAFVENGIKWPGQYEGMSEAWISLAHKVKDMRKGTLEVTPDEAKELADELDNMIDIQQDHMDDFGGRALMRSMKSMYRKARAAQ